MTTTTRQVLVRAARHDDAPALVSLRAAMFEAMGTPAEALADPDWRDGADRWFRDNIREPLVRIVVAEVDGVVAASGVGEVTCLMPGPSCPNGSVGLVSSVVTLPTHRGLGLASACTDAVLDWLAKDTDVTRIDLFATPTAAPMYARRGFATSTFPAMRRPVDQA